MKKTLFILWLLSLGPVFLFAQKDITCKLSEREPLFFKELDEVEGIKGNVTIILTDTTNLSDATVEIEFENLDKNDQFLVFFSEELSDKELKKSHIFRDKKLLINSNTKIEACRWLEGGIVFLAPSEKYTLISDFKVVRGKETVCAIPFFSAKKKKTFLNLYNRTILLKKHKVNLKITVEDKIDFAVPELARELDTLSYAYRKAIKDGQFCTNPKCKNPEHKSSTLDRRAQPYRWQKKELQTRIENAQNQWPSGCKQHKRYRELFRQLDSIRLDNDFLDNNSNLDCPILPPPPHHCKYCEFPLDTLRNRIEHYFTVYSDNTEINRKDWNEVNLIYICSKQPKRDKEKQAKGLRGEIINYYNALKGKKKL